ncbi:hypothetical protein SISNIDRAFT_469967 [Sistotremastrum niveocremeum HHB9708]|uniref:Uncharacterized protein n=1 Tax=Sistotremastrum niveocremeum HHB9708 TaxID=1314777 RepID=A0A164PG97_9AGAM|nr:hypothetical protein SISNIDRAFT_469967 [Sistotremastrum niveocremeum HHB9708]
MTQWTSLINFNIPEVPGPSWLSDRDIHGFPKDTKDTGLQRVFVPFNSTDTCELPAITVAQNRPRFNPISRMGWTFKWADWAATISEDIRFEREAFFEDGLTKTESLTSVVIDSRGKRAKRVAVRLRWLGHRQEESWDSRERTYKCVYACGYEYAHT